MLSSVLPLVLLCAGVHSQHAATFNINSDGTSSVGGNVAHEHWNNFGSQLTGAEKLNLLHNTKHNLDANAFATRHMPNIPQVPNFNTYGGNLDYMNKRASLLQPWVQNAVRKAPPLSTAQLPLSTVNPTKNYLNALPIA
ncbi:unnamed protein product [Chilo suppressalis]|uniref:Attacin C-terminal domain-containing protein n=1 Tax=Chilo suppressalis TaxID=168631 RepID=A0ABN8BB55_CHISP|nr:unnamed protein product [Chilo suppressalis]